MSIDDISATLGPRTMKFLLEEAAAQEADELPALVPKGRPLPDELRLLHEHRTLSIRLRQTAQAVGTPMDRAEADAEAERMLAAEQGVPVAAFREALARFAPRATTLDEDA